MKFNIILLVLNSIIQLKILNCDFISKNQYSSLRIFSYLKTAPTVFERFYFQKWYIGGAGFEPKCDRRPTSSTFFRNFHQTMDFFAKYGLVTLIQIPIEGTPPLVYISSVLIIRYYKYNQSTNQF